MRFQDDQIVRYGGLTPAFPQRITLEADQHWHALWGAFQREQRKPTIILLLSPLLVVTWKYLGARETILTLLPADWYLWSNPQATAAVVNYVLALLLLAVVPALVVKFVFHERLADYGVQWGNRVRTLRSLAILGPVFVFAGYVGSRDAAFLSEYPANPLAGSSPALFGLHALSYCVFYVAWEFHFRGFVQFGLRSSMGDVNAVLVVVLASVLAHLGKPGSETFGAVVGGLLWGMLAFRTRSLFSGLVQHALLGISLDWFICHG